MARLFAGPKPCANPKKQICAYSQKQNAEVCQAEKLHRCSHSRSSLGQLFRGCDSCAQFKGPVSSASMKWTLYFCDDLQEWFCEVLLGCGGVVVWCGVVAGAELFAGAGFAEGVPKGTVTKHA